MIKTIKQHARIYRGVKLPWFLLAICFAVSFITALLNIQAATLTASIIDASQNAIATDELIEYVLNLLGYGVMLVVDAYLVNMAYEKINLGVRIKLWNKIIRMPASYYDKDNGNELISRVTTDASNSSKYFKLIISTVTAIYSAVTVFIRLFNFNTTLAAWMLLIFPCIFGIGGLYAFMGYHAGRLTNTSFAATTGYLAERVRNFRMIKAFGTQIAESKLAAKLFHKQYGADFLSEMSIAAIQLGIQIINCVSILIAFVAGGKMVAAGTLTIGRLVAFYSLSGIAAINLMQLYMNCGSFAEINGVMQKIAQVLDAEEELPDGPPVPDTDEDIRLENVDFAYGEVPVLKGVSFTVPAKKVTAIIGTNGSGKSTVLKLLERLYDPASGSIFFGETDIGGFGLKNWRNTFAMVAQNSPLLAGSVRENILYGVDQPVSEEELIQIAKQADIYDFLMATPGGFDAEVGPGGTNFSGGQRQCIAIARALIKNPRYLLLDEATSNLDVTCENRITQTFDKLMEGRTTVMVAHSRAATAMADHIVVMRSGRVEAEGSPEELLETNEYYRLFMKTGDECGGS